MFCILINFIHYASHSRPPPPPQSSFKELYCGWFPLEAENHAQCIGYRQNLALVQ